MSDTILVWVEKSLVTTRLWDKKKKRAQREIRSKNKNRLQNWSIKIQPQINGKNLLKEIFWRNLIKDEKLNKNLWNLKILMKGRYNFRNFWSYLHKNTKILTFLKIQSCKIEKKNIRRILILFLKFLKLKLRN